MVEAGSDGEELVWDQVRRDNQHFKSLLDLVPPQVYFSLEEKNEIWGNPSEDEDDDEDRPGKKRKKKRKGHSQSLSSYSVTQLTEMKQKGETLGAKKQKKELQTDKTNGTEIVDNSIEMKHLGKKMSRSSKGKKNKGKELEKREARLEELREKLRKKLADMKAMKNSGGAAPTQEEKRLRRKQSKLNAKLKKKGGGNAATHKEERAALQAEHGLKSPPRNEILNQNGQPVKSKFDFSVISFDGQQGEKKQKTSDLQGRDYKRLQEKVERRKEKVEQLKEKDPTAGKKLEEKFAWQAMLSKARGEKVKDDLNLLKKAAKRKEKVKERKGAKWDARKKVTEDLQKKRVDKRQANIDKRKDATKEKKRKKMIKKGRIIPGF